MSSFFNKFDKIPYSSSHIPATNIPNIYKHVIANSDLLDDITLYKFYRISQGERPDQLSQKLYGTSDFHWVFFIINTHLKQGLGNWPLNQVDFEEYLAEEFSGTVVNTRPKFIRNSDGILISIDNSVAGRFQIGEPVTGILSGASGTIIGKDPNLQQLIIGDVTGEFRENELVRGELSGDTISTYEVFKYVDAPKEYHDPEGRVVDNALFIGGSTDGLVRGGHNPNTLEAKSYRECEEALNEARSNIRIIKPDYIHQFVTRFEDLLKDANIN